MSADVRPIYRSTKSVPDRVDKAWGQGFDAGRRDVLRVLGGIAVVECVRFMRRHRVPGLVLGLLALVLGVVVVGSCVLVWTVRRLRQAWVIVPASNVSVLLEDGSVF